MCFPVIAVLDKFLSNVNLSIAGKFAVSKGVLVYGKKFYGCMKKFKT